MPYTVNIWNFTVNELHVMHSSTHQQSVDSETVLVGLVESVDEVVFGGDWVVFLGSVEWCHQCITVWMIEEDG
jgi:hypothetical protein